VASRAGPAYGRNVSPPRNVSIGASRSIFPRSTRVSKAVAVIDFDTDARMYGVCGVARIFFSLSAQPHDRAHMIRPS
jgi:hypothetical protein